MNIFSGTPLTGSNPLTVEFTPTITGATATYRWNFGDKKNSSDSNPIHTYEVPGIYTVTLIIVKDGTTYSETKNDYISVDLNFTGSPRSGKPRLKVTFNS